MFNKIIPLVLLMAACAAKQSDEAPPGWIVGKYHYSGNGSVAKKFPWDAESDLVLDHDGQYTLSVRVRVNADKGKDEDEHESYGTFYVDGERLMLQPANEDDSGDTEEFRIAGKRLVPKLPWTARLALKGFRIPAPVFVKTD
jgi:hypothetical protein